MRLIPRDARNKIRLVLAAVADPGPAQAGSISAVNECTTRPPAFDTVQTIHKPRFRMIPGISISLIQFLFRPADKLFCWYFSEWIRYIIYSKK